MLLVAAILLSTAVVMLESVASIAAEHRGLLRVTEWVLTIAFTIEYVLRLVCVARPGRYARSFYGVIDLLAILPTYVSLLVPGAQYLLVIRLLRVLRIFRVLKLVHYVTELELMTAALRASGRKIFVFLFAVLSLVVVMGSLMYLIEGPEHGFMNIPTGIYWAVVTLTTVGYGDISPSTPLGQVFAAAIMILGYGMIAVPTGIVSVEFARVGPVDLSGRACEACGLEGHDLDARHCKHCGEVL